MHGGADGSGAPKGNTNALRHGRYTGAAIEAQREVAELIRDGREFLRRMRRDLSG